MRVERRTRLGMCGMIFQELVELGAGLHSQLLRLVGILGELGGHLHTAGEFQVERLGQAGGDFLLRLQLLEVHRPQVAEPLLPQPLDELQLQLRSEQREGRDQQQGRTQKRSETTIHRQFLFTANSLRRGPLHCCRLFQKNVARRP